MVGRIGLNYPSVFATMTETGVPAEKRRNLFNDLQVIEGAVLELQAENAKTDT